MQSWITINKCPACGCDSGTSEGKLPGFQYSFGKEQILFPDEGIQLISCDQCGIVYKSIVPSPQFLSKVFMRQADSVWTDEYKFIPEVSTIKKLTKGKEFDLLDIGSSTGGLLKACANMEGRRSALDVLHNSYIDNYIRGEFIQGLLEDSNLSWSNKPYDIVTLFDVAEHFYQPDIAWSNLNKLTRQGGFVIIETGDTESYWSRRNGLNSWLYTRLFEHHVFWNQNSLNFLAEKHGFKIIAWTRKRHKKSITYSLLTKLINFVKVGVYITAPIAYKSLAKKSGKQSDQPGNLFARDHFRVVLQKTVES